MIIETLDDLVKLNGFKKIIRFLKSNGAFYLMIRYMTSFQTLTILLSLVNQKKEACGGVTKRSIIINSMK